MLSNVVVKNTKKWRERERERENNANKKTISTHTHRQTLSTELSRNLSPPKKVKYCGQKRDGERNIKFSCFFMLETFQKM